MNAPVGFCLSIKIDAEVHGGNDDMISLSVSSQPRGVIDEESSIDDIAEAAAESLRHMIIRVYHRAQEVAALEQELAEVDRGQEE